MQKSRQRSASEFCVWPMPAKSLSVRQRALQLNRRSRKLLEKFRGSAGLSIQNLDRSPTGQGPLICRRARSSLRSLQADPRGPVFRSESSPRKFLYHIALKNPSPACSVPPLDSIRDIVIDDYRHAQARELARQAGLPSTTRLPTGLARQKSFDRLPGGEVASA